VPVVILPLKQKTQMFMGLNPKQKGTGTYFSKHAVFILISLDISKDIVDLILPANSYYNKTGKRQTGVS